MRARVLAARERQRARGAGVLNARLDGPALVDACALDDNAWQLLEKAGTKLGLSARGVNRVRKVARTIADLAGEDAVRWDHIAEALQFRAAVTELGPAGMARTGFRNDLSRPVSAVPLTVV